MAEIAKTVAEAMATVRTFVRTSGLSKSKIARDAGLTRNALQNIDKPTWRPEPETLDKLLLFIRTYAQRTGRPSRSPARAQFAEA